MWTSYRSVILFFARLDGVASSACALYRSVILFFARLGGVVNSAWASCSSVILFVAQLERSCKFGADLVSVGRIKPELPHTER